jgi:serine protease Do
VRLPPLHVLGRLVTMNFRGARPQSVANLTYGPRLSVRGIIYFYRNLEAVCMVSKNLMSVMRTILLGATVLSVGASATLSVPVQARAQVQPPATHGPASVADLAEGLLDAVVNISTSQNVRSRGPERNTPRPSLPEGSPFQEFFDEFFGDKGGEGNRSGPRRVQSLGSGFVVDAAEGIVITNNHVIAEADEIEVNFADGGKLKAELVGTDPQTDIAVLKVDPSLRKLTQVEFGDSTAIRIGDWVMAIGNPFGLGGSVSIGIVSARGRDIQSGPYDDFIQTDAAINRGNSGGPLFDMHGKVIGINTAIISPSGGSIGIGFSIPSQLAENVISQLRKFGETRRGWLGVRIQPVTDEIAESLGMDRAQGALVAGVIQGGPVDDGTILPGDVIVRFDGKAINAMRDLPRIVAESPVGKAVDVIVIRKGEEQTVAVTLGRLEDSQDAAEEETETPEAAPAENVSVLGMTIAEIDEETRAGFEIAQDVTGVVITEVEQGSAAQERGVSAGDVIVEIAQETVATPKDVLDRIAALKDQGRRNALLMLSSASGELRFVTLRMD